MAYSPVPLGIQSMDPLSGDGGGGFCTPQLTPYGQTNLSACFDNDFANGSPSTDPRGHPSGGWFQTMWERDFPYMKELGVNTLRLYHANPVSKLYVDKYKSIEPDLIADVGPEHRPFLDLAYQYGFKVIFPIVSDEALLFGTPPDRLERFVQTQVEEVGDHPALLMWIMGNEFNLFSNQDKIPFLNYWFDYVRNYTFATFQRTLPVTHAIEDYPPSYELLVKELHVDVFTSNCGYRGFTFGNLWDGDGASFPGWKNLSKTFNKPLLIGEEGFPGDWTVNYKFPTWFNSQWEDLVHHIDDSGVVGSIFFEYSDEPFKGCGGCVDQKTLGVVNFTVWIGESICLCTRHCDSQRQHFRLRRKWHL
jgi:hypothetical protein